MKYKILTKLLVSRLRPLLDRAVSSPNRSSFIPWRSTNDNTVLVTQELIRSFLHKKGMIDQVSWSFIEQILIEFILNPWMDETY